MKKMTLALAVVALCVCLAACGGGVSNEDYAAVIAENEEMEQTLNETLARYSQLEQDFNDMNGKLVEAEEARDAALGEVAEKDAEIGRLNDEITSANAVIAGLMADED